MDKKKYLATIYTIKTTLALVDGESPEDVKDILEKSKEGELTWMSVPVCTFIFVSVAEDAGYDEGA